jgi:hypothetical protein
MIQLTPETLFGNTLITMGRKLVSKPVQSVDLLKTDEVGLKVFQVSCEQLRTVTPPKVA